MPTFNNKGFSPEQCKALSVIESVLPIKQTRTTMPTLEEICKTGSLFILEGKISTSKIPRGNKWLWNQSRARKETKDSSSSTKLLFFKLNTRKSRAAPNAPYPPPLKVWVFIVTSTFEKTHSVLWCERGFNEAKTDLPKEEDEELEFDDFVIEPKDVSLEELQFLRPFLSDTTATALGWETNYNCESLQFDEFLNNVFTTWD